MSEDIFQIILWGIVAVIAIYLFIQVLPYLITGLVLLGLIKAYELWQGRKP